MGRKLASLDQDLFKQFKHEKGTYHKWRQEQAINQEYDSIAQLLRNKKQESSSPAVAKKQQGTLGKKSIEMTLITKGGSKYMLMHVDTSMGMLMNCQWGKVWTT